MHKHQKSELLKAPKMRFKTSLLPVTELNLENGIINKIGIIYKPDIEENLYEDLLEPLDDSISEDDWATQSKPRGIILKTLQKNVSDLKIKENGEDEGEDDGENMIENNNEDIFE